MAENCPTDCPLLAVCQPNIERVNSMRIASVRAAISVQRQEDPTAPAPQDDLETDPNIRLFENAAEAEAELVIGQVECSGRKISKAVKLARAINLFGLLNGWAPTGQVVQAVRITDNADSTRCPSDRANMAANKILRLPLS